MKVVSKLVDLELHIGHIERRGNLLLVHSDPERSMPTTIHIAPKDMFEILKIMLKSRELWKFLLMSPWYFLGSKKRSKIAPTIDSQNKLHSGNQKWDPWE